MKPANIVHLLPAQLVFSLFLLVLLPASSSAGPARADRGRVPLVPVVRLGDPRESMTLQETRSGAVRLIPLADVRLPWIGLPVDGLYPDQTGYPLWSEGPSSPEADAASDTRAGSERLVWIGAVGDVMPARGVDAVLLGPSGPDRVFGNTLPILKGFDLLLGNLEGAATVAGTKAAKTFTFRFNPAALGRLRDAGFSYMGIANNHSFDFGEKGFLDTLQNLSKWGIETSGAGASETEASLPFVARIGGTEVRIFSAGDYPVDRKGFDGHKSARARGAKPGILWLDEQGFKAIAAGCSAGSFDIVFVHGGHEWESRPSAEQTRSYRRLVQDGADLVIGAHPHVLQGLQSCETGLIAYSLGNFVFPGMHETDGGEEAAILSLGLYQGSVRYVRTLPVRLSGRSVRLDTGSSIRHRLRKLTAALDAAR